jgi:1-acyl-sn-glycerol-3-phosphate acyltransferase
MGIAAAQSLRRWVRVGRLALHLARGVLIAALLFPFHNAERRRREIQRWSRKLLALLAVRLSVHGTPPSKSVRPLMLVSNHVSWLDIFAIDAVVPSRFVAKSEVRSWPVMGWLCERVGTLFIERARRHDTVRINHAAGDALRAGDVFAVFPEGTTTDGSTVLKFHASLLAPALEAGAAIQPVALRFERTDGSLCTEAAYDGEKSLWDALMGITSEREIVARVWFLPPIAPEQSHRRDLARAARDAILLTLFPRAPDSRTDTAGDLRAAAL